MKKDEMGFVIPVVALFTCLYLLEHVTPTDRVDDNCPKVPCMQSEGIICMPSFPFIFQGLLGIPDATLSFANDPDIVVLAVPNWIPLNIVRRESSANEILSMSQIIRRVSAKTPMAWTRLKLLDEMEGLSFSWQSRRPYGRHDI